MSEIPIWVDGRCRWVSGVCRKTTCQDVLEAVLKAPLPPPLASSASSAALSKTAAGVGTCAPEPDPASHVIIERWKGMERRLDARAKILKVWAAWGAAQSDVQLEVRRVAERRPTSRRHHRPHRSSRAQVTREGRDRDRDRDPDASTGPGGSANADVQRLMRLILVQGQTIAGQLRRLREREAQIERLEVETHSQRVQQHGQDYVQAAYLNEPNPNVQEDTPKTSVPSRTRQLRPRQIVDEGESDAEDEDARDVRARIALWEKVVKVNKRLESQEESLVRLYVWFRRVSPDQPAVDDREQLHEALNRLQQEIDAGRADLKLNAELLTEMESLLCAKRRFLQRLHCELEIAEQDTQRLLAAQAAMAKETFHSQSTTPASVGATTCVNAHRSALKSHITPDTDSNSDTGLSSLHSSSEEGVCVLDTLV